VLIDMYTAVQLDGLAADFDHATQVSKRVACFARLSASLVCFLTVL